MAILTGSNKTEKKPTMTANNIPPAMQNQLDNIFESGKNNETVSRTKEPKAKKEVKRDNSDALMLRLPKGERQAFKTFCASKGTDMTNFIFACMDFVRLGTEEGYIQVSKAGVKLLRSKLME